MFIKSDIEKVFSNAETSKDEFLKKEIIISSLGELLLKDKPDIVALLKERQINVKSTDKDLSVVVYMIEQIRRSDDFTRKISRLILQKDGKSDSYINSQAGTDLKNKIFTTLKIIAKDNKNVDYIVESRMQHLYYNSEGMIIKNNKGIYYAALAALAIYGGYKIFTFIKKGGKVKFEYGGEVDSEDTESNEKIEQSENVEEDGNQ